MVRRGNSGVRGKGRVRVRVGGGGVFVLVPLLMQPEMFCLLQVDLGWGCTVDRCNRSEQGLHH